MEFSNALSDEDKDHMASAAAEAEASIDDDTCVHCGHGYMVHRTAYGGAHCIGLVAPVRKVVVPYAQELLTKGARPCDCPGYEV